TDNAAHARGRALVRLHGAGMVVALDLEHQGLPVADIYRTGVLARPLQDTWPRGGEALEQRLGVLVAAVLRPHGAEHTQLNRVRRAAEPGHDGLILLARQRHLAEDGIGDRAVGHQRSAISPWLIGLPG